MSDRITVRAASVRVPLEGGAGWIERDPTAVPNTHYYRAALADGSLVLCDAAPEAPSTPDLKDSADAD